KDFLSDVQGLKNDIVFKVFTCPDCRTDVTISRYQTLGQLPILCARCNHRYEISGEALLAPAPVAAYQPETYQDGKPTAHGSAYKVYAGLDAAQKAAPVPKDSFLLVMKPELAPKPVPAAPAAPKPAA
ncbi:MAG TPA: hypothetical protein VNZ67_05730, partial [bacterium]|nr:hypothetical protein [bacterium]